MKKKILIWILASVLSAVSLPAAYADTSNSEPSPLPPVSQDTEDLYEGLIEQWFDAFQRSIEDVVSFIEDQVYEGSYLDSIAAWLQKQGGSASKSYDDEQGNSWKGTAALIGNDSNVPREFLLTIDKNGQSQQYITKWTAGSRSPNHYSVNLQPVPIDGGASILLAAGAAYGLKRLRRRKEQQ